MKPSHHYIAHAFSIVVIAWLIAIINSKPSTQMVSKVLLDAKIEEVQEAKNERDSIAILLERSAQKIDSIKNRPIEREVIYLTRKDEITLIKSRDLLDSVRSAIAE